MDGLFSTALVVAHSPGWDNGGSEWWWIGRLVMFLFWIVLIFAAFWWFRRGWRHHEPTGIERARNILAERYARGEITTEEYHDRLGQLN